MRLTFLSHFVLCLAVAAGGFFAHVNGVFGVVWAGDASHMTSVIAALFVATAVWLGLKAWDIDSFCEFKRKMREQYPGGKFSISGDSAAFGHLAERLLPMCGLLGTAIGLSLQAKELVGGAAAFGPLATSLYCTAAGVAAAAIVAAMTFNLERGIARAGR